MIHKIYPCLWFTDQANEAAHFYADVFDDVKITSSNPVVTMLEVSGETIMLLNDNRNQPINPSVSLFVLSNDQEELSKYWHKLSSGGQIHMALDQYPWSKFYGMCTDSYGVSWQIMLGNIGDQKIVPSLMFTNNTNGKAEAAIQEYTSLFPNSAIVSLNRYNQGEGEQEGNIKHAQFIVNGFWMTAMDSSGDHSFDFNEGVSFVVNCDTQEEIDLLWNHFTKKGEENMCGWCKDQFGVSWQIVPSILGSLMSDPANAGKVVQAFMKMRKFDIAKLVAAAGR